MACADFPILGKSPAVVGSFGSIDSLRTVPVSKVRDDCDLAEIRLDLLAAAGGTIDPAAWRHLAGIPLLFTARRREEGGALDLDARARGELLETALDDACLIDIEIAAIAEMKGLLETIRERDLPWVASLHDFVKLPDRKLLEKALTEARDAGAACFKVAAAVHSPADIAWLAEFQRTDHGIRVATMGMGPLAPVSRLLCAQYGSALNYGYLGSTPTAPGQWQAGLLKKAIAALDPI